MGELLTYYSITGLINAVVSLSFALYLTVTSWKVRMTRYLVYLCLALGAWSTGYFLWQISTTHDDALFWSRGLMVGAIFTSISFLHLVIVFLQLDKQRFYKIMLILFYIPCVFFEIVNFTPLFVADVGQRMFFKFWPLPGIFLLPQVVLFSAHLVIASSLLYKKYKNSKGLDKKQALMLLVGITLTFLGGSTNYFLWFNIPIPPWGNGIASAYALFSVYAIMRYGFLNLRIIIAEIFAGLLIILSFADVLLADTTSKFVFNVVKFIIFSFLSYMLIRSVHKEIHHREEVTSLAHSLERANLRLQELDRQKTEFLSIASHQLRTPLSILKGFIELLSDGAYGKPTKKMSETLVNMDESNERLIKLVDDFLDVTRIEQGRTKFNYLEKDINEVIEDVIKEIHQRAEDKGLKIKWDKKKLPFVKMDDEKVRHVVFNFVDNAIKYTNKGVIKIITEMEKNGVRFRVKDNGIGFNKKDEANFYQKFYRGENVQNMNVTGTGLGLYVCRKFIETHGGHVEAHSAGLSKGGEFNFWLPLVPTQQNTGKIEEDKSQPVSSQPEVS